MEKTAAAKHAADYRARKKEASKRLGIESITIETAQGVRSGMNIAMVDHGYSQIQELWQDMALSFLAMPRDEQARRLKKPNASAFVITEKLSRQFEKESRREAERDSDIEIIRPGR
jgi:hypothetical protein